MEEREERKKERKKTMESQIEEYKEQWHDEYLKWICGFANAQGGSIYIGIDDNGIVKGIANARKLMEDIPNKVRDTMGIIVNVNLLNKNGLEYIQIVVPDSSMPITYRGKYYFRSGSTLQELGGVALTDFLMRQTHITWDMHVEPNATLDDIDTEAVNYFVNFAIDSKRLDESAKHESVDNILRKLKLVNKQGQLTFAALMLFRIGRFGATQADLIFDDNIVCPLIKMPERIMQTLRSRYLIAPVKYDGMRRVEPLEIPEDALREMICNSIVHKDYRGTFIQMRVWDDHIDLWNSGVFPPEITSENLMTTHESHPRNELIAKVFYLAGFIESWGRGYEKIKSAFAKENLQIPTFEQVRGGVLATIQRERFVELRKQNVGDNVGDVSEMELTERQKNILSLIKDNPYISATQMSVMLSVIKRTIERELAVMKKNGIIYREGNARTGCWVINSPYKN